MGNNVDEMAIRLGQLIGEWLRETRTLKGLSLRALAKKSGVNKNTIDKYEKGFPNMDISLLIRIVRGMDCQISFDLSERLPEEDQQ